MKKLTATAGTKSKLAKPVQELIKTIFDVESMKKAMVEFEVRPVAHERETTSDGSSSLQPASHHVFWQCESFCSYYLIPRTKIGHQSLRTDICSK